MSNRTPSTKLNRSERRVIVAHADLRTPPDLRQLARAIIAMEMEKKDQAGRDL